MNQHDGIARILVSLSEAMLDDTLWPATAALIDEACGATGNALVAAERSMAGVDIAFARFCSLGQRNHESERRYFDLYYPSDERVPRIRQLPDGSLVHVAELFRPDELKTSATYNELLRREGGQDSVLARMEGPDGLYAVWAISDPQRTGGWGSGQLRTIRSLLPHVRQFVLVRQALVSAAALGATVTELLDNTRIGVLHLDRHARIASMNDHARAMLHRGNGLAASGDRLRAWRPADDAVLQRLLAAALPTGAAEPTAGSMTVTGSAPPLPRLALHVAPIARRRFDFAPPSVRALVLMVPFSGVTAPSRPASPADRGPRLIAAALGLGPTESRIASSLAQGNTVRQTAAALGIKESTVRWYLKRIYRKRGVSRQVELVRQVLSVVHGSDPGA